MAAATVFDSATDCPLGFREITIADLKTLPQNIRRIDVRESGELVGDMGLLPNTDHVPMNTVPDESKAWDKAQPIVVICRSGGRSGQVAKWLQAQGFEDIVSLKGGMLAWNEQ